MAFNGRPWAIEKARTEAATARAFANAATQDSQGINLPGDFKVTALSNPGLAVNIAPGAMTLVNKQSPGQSYIGTNEEVTQYPVPANNSGAERWHLLMARVRDPDFAPWQPYTDPQQILYGPFFEPHLASASSTVRNAYDLAEVNYTAEALALIRMPAGAQSVLPQYISPNVGAEVRRLARPRSSYFPDVKPITANQWMLTSHTAWRDWPAEAAWSVPVPRSATHAQAEIEVNGIKADGPGDLDLRINFGGKIGPTTYWDYNGNAGTPAGFVEVLPRTTYGEFAVADLAGGTYTVKLQAMRTYATQNLGQVWVDTPQQVRIHVYFSERVV